MRNKLFDEHVKKQFDGYRPEVAPHIWENIAAAQNKKKPAPFWFLSPGAKWVAAILFIAAATGTVVYFTGSHTSNENIASATTGEKDGSTKQNAGEKNSNSGTDQNSNASQNNTEALTNTGAMPANADNTTANTQPSGNNTNPANKMTEPQADNGTNNDNPVFDPATAARTAKVKQGMRTKITNGTTVNDEGVTDNYTFANEKYLTKRFVTAGLISNDKKLAAPKLYLPKLPLSANIPCPEAEKDAAGNKSYVEIYGGPDYAFKNFADTPNSAYLQQRKESVKLLFAFSAGLRYTKVFKNGMSLRTGINYSQVNERFTYVKGNVVHSTYIISPSGDTTGTYSERGTQYQSGTNKYRSIDIPVVLGYELGNGRFHSNVNAGVLINVVSRQSGFVLDPSGQPVDISSGKQSTVYSYRTNAGVSFVGAVSMYYKLNDQFHLLAEPYFRYSLTPMTKPDISLKERGHTIGLRVGLRMDL